MTARYLSFSLAALLVLGGCKEAKTTQKPPVVTEKDTPRSIPADLVKAYADGQVQMCRYQDKVVYMCGRNAPDAGSEVFDAKGNKIGGCYYATNQVDDVCREANQCRVIHRGFPNIWGLPKVEYAEF